MSQPRTVHGLRFLDALAAAGIITDADRVNRVVIDAPIADVVTIHVQRYGDERLLSVVPTLTGIDIRTEPDPRTAATPVAYCPHIACEDMGGWLRCRNCGGPVPDLEPDPRTAPER